MTATFAHGYSAYQNHACRCATCRQANRTYMRAWRQARYQETAARGLQPDVPHGTVNAYENYGCRCRACRDSHAAANRRREHAKEV